MQGRIVDQGEEGTRDEGNCGTEQSKAGEYSTNLRLVNRLTAI